MQILLFITLITFVLPLEAKPLSKKYSNFVVEVKMGFNKPKIVRFPVNKDDGDNLIWLSESGIRCTFSPWAKGYEATFECNGPDNYKVQTTFSCSINNSKKTKGYIWVGKVGMKFPKYLGQFNQSGYNPMQGDYNHGKAQEVQRRI
tara:strand:+ start:1468 stop:1905 length:438 start_codon:yes stop_codon:yes gene_type:complete